jgi:hypothetical protein
MRPTEVALAADHHTANSPALSQTMKYPHVNWPRDAVYGRISMDAHGERSFYLLWHEGKLFAEIKKNTRRLVIEISLSDAADIAAKLKKLVSPETKKGFFRGMEPGEPGPASSKTKAVARSPKRQK